ncbi:MAG: hypothetical protein HGB11_12925 [Chlorobiales bacterium]|nr:hypothetical protein [Chlorobiales bacterium]
MPWWVLYVFALPIFFILVFIFYKFVSYHIEHQNLKIEPLSEIVSDNPVGLPKEDLEKLKQKQAEAQKHLADVISKVPVDMVNGRFVAKPEKLKEAMESAKKSENGINGKS